MCAKLVVTTINLNGIRAASSKGVFEHLLLKDPDIICVQETKAQYEQIADAVWHPEGYYRYFSDAQKKGYSGVGIYAKREPDLVQYGVDWDLSDREGRFIRADFGKLTVISVYFPSGSSGEDKQANKYAFMSHYGARVLPELFNSGQDVIICGDINIAHRKIDIKNWRSNQKNSGFLPSERCWMSLLLDQAGWVDVYRHLKPKVVEYTWWSYRANARANNVGWRIDYHLATPRIANCARACYIDRDPIFSDHAPLTVEYEV